MTCIPRGVRNRERGGSGWRGRLAPPFDTSFLEPFFRRPLTERISTFGISREHISGTRERGRGGEEGRLAGSSHAIRCILPTSCNSFFALLLVSLSLSLSLSVCSLSTAARTFRGRSSHYACPIHSRTARRLRRRIARPRILGETSVRHADTHTPRCVSRSAIAPRFEVVPDVPDFQRVEASLAGCRGKENLRPRRSSWIAARDRSFPDLAQPRKRGRFKFSPKDKKL